MTTEFQATPQDLRTPLLLGGTYRHYKGGLYRVIEIVRHSETLEPLVLYRALYDNELGALWVRPAAMFAGQVEIDGKRVPRFVLQVDARYPYYHAHIYFTTERRAQAARLRDAMRAQWVGRAQVHDLHDVPIGPHPVPMFEADFLGRDSQAIVEWLGAAHGELDVFIHPVSGDDMRDHTELAMFYGRRHELDIERLQAILRMRSRAAD